MLINTEIRILRYIHEVNDDNLTHHKIHDKFRKLNDYEFDKKIKSLIDKKLIILIDEINRNKLEIKCYRLTDLGKSKSEGGFLYKTYKYLCKKLCSLWGFLGGLSLLFFLVFDIPKYITSFHIPTQTEISGQRNKQKNDNCLPSCACGCKRLATPSKTP